jgi:hypothetical protein
MANELSWRQSATGETVYATIRSEGHLYWNTAGTPALEALTVANWADYDVALTEAPASSYFYVGDWPTGLTTVGWYWVDVYKQVGGSPAISDTVIGGFLGYWSGAAFSPWSSALDAATLSYLSAALSAILSGLLVGLTPEALADINAQVTLALTTAGLNYQWGRRPC